MYPEGIVDFESTDYEYSSPNRYGWILHPVSGQHGDLWAGSNYDWIAEYPFDCSRFLVDKNVDVPSSGYTSVISVDLGVCEKYPVSGSISILEAVKVSGISGSSSNYLKDFFVRTFEIVDYDNGTVYYSGNTDVNNEYSSCSNLTFSYGEHRTNFDITDSRAGNRRLKAKLYKPSPAISSFEYRLGDFSVSICGSSIYECQEEPIDLLPTSLTATPTNSFQNQIGLYTNLHQSINNGTYSPNDSEYIVTNVNASSPEVKALIEFENFETETVYSADYNLRMKRTSGDFSLNFSVIGGSKDSPSDSFIVGTGYYSSVSPSSDYYTHTFRVNFGTDSFPASSIDFSEVNFLNLTWSGNSWDTDVLNLSEVDLSLNYQACKATVNESAALYIPGGVNICTRRIVPESGLQANTSWTRENGFTSQIFQSINSEYNDSVGTTSADSTWIEASFDGSSSKSFRVKSSQIDNVPFDAILKIRASSDNSFILKDGTALYDADGYLGGNKIAWISSDTELDGFSDWYGYEVPCEVLSGSLNTGGKTETVIVTDVEVSGGSYTLRPYRTIQYSDSVSSPDYDVFLSDYYSYAWSSEASPYPLTGYTDEGILNLTAGSYAALFANLTDGNPSTQAGSVILNTSGKNIAFGGIDFRLSEIDESATALDWFFVVSYQTNGVAVSDFEISLDSFVETSPGAGRYEYISTPPPNVRENIGSLSSSELRTSFININSLKPSYFDITSNLDYGLGIKIIPGDLSYFPLSINEAYILCSGQSSSLKISAVEFETDVECTGILETGIVPLYVSGEPVVAGNIDLYLQSTLYTNDLDLYLHNVQEESGNIPLYIRGGVNDNLNLFIKVDEPILAARTANLFLLGQESGTLTDNLNLFTKSAYISGESVNLFLEVSDVGDSSGWLPLYLPTRSFTEINSKEKNPSGVPLSITGGPLPINASTNLYLPAIFEQSGMMNLFMDSSGAGRINDNISLFTSGLGTESGLVDFFLAGPSSDTPYQTMPLYMDVFGGTSYKSTNLFIPGTGSPSAGSTTLYTKGDIDFSGYNENVNLYMNGEGLSSLTKTANLFTEGNSAALTGVVNLYLGGGSDSGHLNLFIENNRIERPLREISNTATMFTSAHESGVAGISFFAAPLFINGNAHDNLNLYISGPANLDINESLNLVLVGKGADNTVDLFLQNAYTQESGKVNLFVQSPSHLDISGDMSLFIARDSSSLSHRLSMFMSAPEAVSGDFPLYVNGGTDAYNSVNLFMPSSVAQYTKSLNGYVHGF